MKLLRVHIVKAETCGGLLDGLDLQLRQSFDINDGYDPLCFVGVNGAGKSQFLQAIVEIFQSIIHAVSPTEERKEANSGIEFEVEYLIYENNKNVWTTTHVKASRITLEGNKRASLNIAVKDDGDWNYCDLSSELAMKLIPSKIVGYSSGDNETLSLPFLVSRSGYAENVRTAALEKNESLFIDGIPDIRLMLIDYGTNLEVLLANLLLADEIVKKQIIGEAKLSDIYSFRCIIQLNHSAVNREVQLTPELEKDIESLKKASTCYKEDSKTKTIVLDFYFDFECQRAFKFFWDTALKLYTTFHKIAMLNDLAIPKSARDRFNLEIKKRKFATQLPQPQDEDKVFRFESVKFTASNDQVVDYVSLSDGEHQLTQLLGTLSMLCEPNILFILDEPESHFNPQWRVKFISRLLDLKTANGQRKDSQSAISKQDVFITTHTPFILSDMQKDKIFIFKKIDKKINVDFPKTQTFGASFDQIIGSCFEISPSISCLPQEEINRLLVSDDIEEIRSFLQEIGESAGKMLLAERINYLKNRSQGQ